MRAYRKTLFLVGVALCVAPIFSSVSAQQSSQQATMLMEIQALRAEIAELRDMVERQQYQMRQLQRKLDAGASSRPGPPATSLQTNTIGQVPQQQTPTGQLTGVPQPAQGPANGQVSRAPNAGPGLGGPEYPAAGAVVEEGVAPAFEGNQGDFYRPYDPGQGNPNQVEPNQSDPNQVIGTEGVGAISNTGVVEERSVDLSGAKPINDGYPPVEERTIGGGSYQSTGSPTPQGGVSATGTGIRTPGAPNTPATVPGTTGTGAVAPATIPGAVSTGGSPQGYPNVAGTVNPQYPADSPTTGSTGVIAVPGNAGQGSPGQVPVEASGIPATAPTAAVQQPAPAQQVVSAPPVLSEQEYYQQGFELLKQSKHPEAVSVFKRQISTHPAGAFADDAHYWIAESMYVNRSLDDSKKYFKAIIDNFPQSPRLPDAMLKTAYIEQEQGNQIEARILLQEIIQYHPRSNAAISAKNRLAELD